MTAAAFGSADAPRDFDGGVSANRGDRDRKNEERDVI